MRIPAPLLILSVAHVLPAQQFEARPLSDPASGRYDARTIITGMVVCDGYASEAAIQRCSNRLLARHRDELRLNGLHLARRSTQLGSLSSAEGFVQVVPLRDRDGSLVEVDVADTSVRIIYPLRGKSTEAGMVVHSTVESIDSGSLAKQMLDRGDPDVAAKQLIGSQPEAGFVVRTAVCKRLVAHADGVSSRLAFELYAEGVGPRGPRDSRMVVVDAVVGEVLRTWDPKSYAQNGQCGFWVEGPTTTPTWQMGPVFDLDGSGFLRSAEIDVQGFVGQPAFSANNVFNYAALTWAHPLAATTYYSANVYKHASANMRNLRFGVGERWRPAVPVPVILSNFVGDGQYFPASCHIELSFHIWQHEAALDGDLIHHELSHWVSDKTALFGQSLAAHGTGQGLNEGFADLSAAIMANDSKLFETMAGAAGHEFARNVDNHRTRQLNYASQTAWGRANVWSGMFWELAAYAGSRASYQLSLEAMRRLNLVAESPETFLRDAILTADNDLYGGRFQQVILRCAEARGIFLPGSTATNFPPNGLPETPIKPYPDLVVNEIQTYTVPGSPPAILATFAPETALHYEEDSLIGSTTVWKDELIIEDGSGTEVIRFTDRDAAGQTIEISGDTIRTVFSSAMDNRHSLGFRFVQIVAKDPANQPPLPVINLSTPSFMVPGAFVVDLSESSDPDGPTPVLYELHWQGERYFPDPLDPKMTLMTSGHDVLATRNELIEVWVTDVGGAVANASTTIQLVADDEPTTLPALTARTPSISAKLGGHVAFSINAGNQFAGRAYLMLGSTSGISPGTPLGPLGPITLPLNVDGFSSALLSAVNSAPFPGFFGTLSSTGTATAEFDATRLAPFTPSLAGLTIHFAYVGFAPFDFVSNPVAVTMTL